MVSTSLGRSTFHNWWNSASSCALPAGVMLFFDPAGSAGASISSSSASGASVSLTNALFILVQASCGRAPCSSAEQMDEQRERQRHENDTGEGEVEYASFMPDLNVAGQPARAQPIEPGGEQAQYQHRQNDGDQPVLHDGSLADGRKPAAIRTHTVSARCRRAGATCSGARAGGRPGRRRFVLRRGAGARRGGP